MLIWSIHSVEPEVKPEGKPFHVREFFQNRIFHLVLNFSLAVPNNWIDWSNEYKPFRSSEYKCAESGKGFKIGTNEAYNIKTKIRVRGISKIFYFCSYRPIWLPQTEAFQWRGNSWKSFYLTSWIKRNQWKARQQKCFWRFWLCGRIFIPTIAVLEYLQNI